MDNYKIENAAVKVDDAIDAVKAIGTGRKYSAMVRKLTTVKAELAGDATRAKVLSELPVKGTAD